MPGNSNRQTVIHQQVQSTDAATLNKAVLCPVGELWKAHFDTTGDFAYYGPDGFHPSEQGSRVAAEVIYRSLPGAAAPSKN